MELDNFTNDQLISELTKRGFDEWVDLANSFEIEGAAQYLGMGYSYNFDMSDRDCQEQLENSGYTVLDPYDTDEANESAEKLAEKIRIHGTVDKIELIKLLESICNLPVFPKKELEFK